MSLIKGSGVVLVRLCDKYRWCNAIFNPGYASALAVTETSEKIVCLMTFAEEGRL